MISAPEVRRPRRFRKLFGLAAAVWLVAAFWDTHKRLPAGVHVAGPFVATPQDSLRFLADVTFADAQGTRQLRQQIHAATLELVRNARGFLVLDYFLFNAQGGPAGPLRYERGLTPVSDELIAALRELKGAQPDLPVLVITDPINDYYRGTAPPALAGLTALGIDVVVTDLDPLRDTNPVWSTTWRLLVGWWAPSGGTGHLPNLLDGAGPRLKLGALTRLPNFKANHRKVAITGDGAGGLVGIVASANPHDASSAHSNVALRIGGEALRPLLDSELAVAGFSGWRDAHRLAAAIAAMPRAAAPQGPVTVTATAADQATRVAIATEGAIHQQLLQRLAAARAGDAVDLAMFYLSDRPVIEALLAAAGRGAQLRVLLDPNKDAFGFEKNGIPNREVAHELLARGRGNIGLRWYNTHGEQFHTKFIAVRGGGHCWFLLGSANFTVRNLADYNLEADALVDAPVDSGLARDTGTWFDTLWHNADGIAYTAEASAWDETSVARYWLYRFMEATGMSTF